MVDRLKTVLTLGLALAGLSFIVAGRAGAHGVGYRRSSLPAVPLEFSYSTGEAMSYLEARAFSPADEKFAHQSGRTDAAGRFAFVPDVPGRWRVAVRDDEGHQATAEIEIPQEFLTGSSKGAQDAGGRSAMPHGLAIQEQSAAPEGLDLALRAGLGVSLLFNVAAFTLLSRRGRGA